MATATHPAQTPKQKGKGGKRQHMQGMLKTFEKDTRPLQAFLTKFNNDWVMNFASGLSFSILTALFPIVIAIVSIAGLVVGALDPTAKTQLITTISNIFPNTLSAHGENVLAPALLSLSKNAGLVGIIAIVMAVFGGSRLFITLEGYFDIIYHTRPRNVVPQNIMAFAMMLVFLVAQNDSTDPHFPHRSLVRSGWLSPWLPLCLDLLSRHLSGRPQPIN